MNIPLIDLKAQYESLADELNKVTFCKLYTRQKCNRI